MSFLNVMKCVFCLRWSCPKRYQIGNRTYYSYLGFVRTECPKKYKQYSFLPMDEIKEKATKEARERQKTDEEQVVQPQVKNIVVVDDNMQFAQTLIEFLRKPNKSECIAYTSPIAVKKHFADSQVDILVTDYEMPEMTGCELAKEILEKYPSTRVIIMSGHDTKYLEEICKKHGIHGKVETVCKSDIEFFSAIF